MKVLPCPGSLSIRISPPSRRVICRLMERPEAGAAVLAAGAGVALLERLEDDAVLLLGDADAGVAHREGDHRVGGVEHLLLRVPAARWPARALSETEPRSVNLKALESRFLSTCCSRLVSVWIAGGSAGSSSTSNCSPLRSATWRKVLSTNFRTSANGTVRDVHRHGARLDLGEVEDVVDQVEQVGAGAVDGLGEPDLLGGQVPLRVLGQDLGEDEQAVERRPELVRHVGQELRLVLGDEGQLLGLLLQRHLGLLHLLVLLLHLRLLAGEQLGLLLQLGVGPLQLVLLLLEQLLGLLQRAGLLLQPLVGLGQRLLLRLEALGQRLRLLAAAPRSACWRRWC